MNTQGSLFIVATPIGNLNDFSPRAIQTLQNVDLIAAEDTRHTQQLLHHFQIKKTLISLHEHNETKTTQKLISFLKEGKSIALVSDAGTPLISDPGHTLVAEAHLEHITVIPIPGPCAAITALSAAGFSQTEFIFIGFLPSKPTQRETILKSLAQETRTLIFYEAPHRIVETLQAMQVIFGETRKLCFARELTKRYETVRVGFLHDITQWVTEDKNQQQGECVLVIAGATIEKKEISSEHDRVLRLLLHALPTKKAAQLTSQITGISKNTLYDLALIIKEKEAKK